jgi:glycosyltransferase involved in cell wall biosynthesis
MLTTDRSESICVIGRTDFTTGMGMMSMAACELLSRHFSMALLDTRCDGSRTETLRLPTGRSVDLVDSAEGFAASFYCDVIWNGADDDNIKRVPTEGLRVAHVVWDSDLLPPEWVGIMNERFDLVLFSSRHLETVAKSSGVKTPVGTLPIALDLEGLLSRPARSPSSGPVKVGSLSAFHRRKGLEPLVTSFAHRFGERPDIGLTLHSNLDIGGEYEQLRPLAKHACNVELSRGSWTTEEKEGFLQSLDIYVNCSQGEGYSIGPREALASGKVLVLSDLGAHEDLQTVPGVFCIPSSGSSPARFPEIDNRVIGNQRTFSEGDIADQLEAAVKFARSPECRTTASARREHATQYSFSRMEAAYVAVFDPAVVARVSEPPPERVNLPEASQALATKALGRHATRLRPGGMVLVDIRDAGFFSLFNVFLSHLVWSRFDPSISVVVPNWQVDRLLDQAGGEALTSYCYSRPEDGNLWTSLFEPLYDLSVDEMNDQEWLEAAGTYTPDVFNYDFEPWITAVNAFELYRSPGFDGIRRQYKATMDRHVRLLPGRKSEIDGFVSEHLEGRPTVAAHVRHPSHVIEQPGGVIAAQQRYVDEVRDSLAQRGIDEATPDWRVFLATDQERVVDLFRDHFGDHVVFHDGVDRTPRAVDEAFDRLDPAEQAREGHQFQHLMAAERDNWSPELAWQVWRDAETMAACDGVIHVVSNVSTAVSFMNPETEMIYCSH